MFLFFRTLKKGGTFSPEIFYQRKNIERMSELIKEGISIVSEAVTADQAHDSDRAIALYTFVIFQETHNFFFSFFFLLVNSYKLHF